MTRGPALALAFVTLLLVRPARADGDGTRPLAPDVDFSKPPAQVEGYNKVRFTCTTEVRPEGRTFAIEGKAYYPDGVAFTVTLRYWKHLQPFVRGRAEVRDRKFSVSLGPFPRAIPGGEVVAEVWFELLKQPRPMQRRLVDEKYMSCSPPCHFDRRNATRVSVNLGGQVAQEQEEQAEKEQLKRGVDAITAAFRGFEQLCLAVRQEKEPVERAETSLAQLAADLKAATDQLATWRNTRLFVLFPQRANETDSLASQALEAGRLHAAVAGVKVDTLPTGQASFEDLTQTLRALREQSDVLRGFLAEEGTLDKDWAKLNDAARAKWDEANPPPAQPGQPTTTTPPARPGGR